VVRERGGRKTSLTLQGSFFTLGKGSFVKRSKKTGEANRRNGEDLRLVASAISPAILNTGGKGPFTRIYSFGKGEGGEV